MPQLTLQYDVEELVLLGLDASIVVEVDVLLGDDHCVEVQAFRVVTVEVYNLAGDVVNPATFGYNSQEIMSAALAEAKKWFDETDFEDDACEQADKEYEAAYDDAADHRMRSIRESGL